MKTFGLMGIGGVLWFIGWWEVSDRAAMDEQIAVLNLAVVGLIVVGAGQASWFLAGRRAVGHRRRALLGDRARRTAVAPVAPTSHELVVGGERFFHRLDCAMAADRGWSPAPRAAQEQAGRVPCGVCAP